MTKYKHKFIALHPKLARDGFCLGQSLTIETTGLPDPIIIDKITQIDKWKIAAVTYLIWVKDYGFNWINEDDLND